MTNEAINLVVEFCSAMADWHRECYEQDLANPEWEEEAWNEFMAERLRVKNEILSKYTTQKKPVLGFSFKKGVDPLVRMGS